MSQIKHTIYTNNTTSIKQREYRLSPAENKKAIKEIKKMLNNKIIRKLQILWLLLIVFIKKSDRSI
jgi:hypothetical protein